MKTVWIKNRRKDLNTRAIFQYFCKKADKIEFVALDLYQLHVNGEFIAQGPSRTAYGYCKKETFDLSKYQNFYITIEVLCYNTPCYEVASGNPLFGCKVYSDGKIIADTDGFICYEVSDYERKMQKYSSQRGFCEKYVMQSCRKNLYNGKESFVVATTEEVPCPPIIDRTIYYPLHEREECVIVESGLVSVDETLPRWSQEIRMNTDSNNVLCFNIEEITDLLSETVSQFSYKKSKVSPQILTDKTYLVYNFERIVVGFLNAKLTVKKDAEVYFIWSECAEEKDGQLFVDFSRNTCCDVVKYQLKSGEYDLMTFNPYCLQYARIVCLAGEISVEDFCVISMKNKNQKRISLTCENKKLENIFGAAQNSLAYNAVDVFTDCPGRERAGWLCDSYFMAKAEKLLFGSNAVERNFLENYVLAKNFNQTYPKGMIPMCYPSIVTSGRFIPNWALWFVLEVADYKERNGYDQLVIDAKEKVLGVLNYFEGLENSDGLLEDLKSWVFVEWSKANEFVNGVNYPSNMLYCRALEVAGELYGDNEKIEKAKRKKELIIKQSFNGEFFEDNAVRDDDGNIVRTGNISETCQYYALYFGFADGVKFTHYKNIIISKFGRKRDDKNTYPNVFKSNAFIGNLLRLCCLLKEKEYKRVLDEVENFYYDQAKLTDTLWEHDSIRSSLNHGFGSYVACLIAESLQNSNQYKHQISINSQI